MMSRSIFWSSSQERFDDGFWRRRVLMPAAGLASLGWGRETRASAAADSENVRAAVVDAADPTAIEIARAFVRRNTPLFVDLARWLELERNDWHSLRPLTDLAYAVVVPTTASVGATQISLGAARLATAPDPIETPYAMQMAAASSATAYCPSSIASAPYPDLLLWYAEADADIAAEIDDVRSLVPHVGPAGFRLLAAVPESSLASIRLALPNIPAVAATLADRFSVLTGARALVLPLRASPSFSGCRRAELATAAGLPVLARSADTVNRRGVTIAENWRDGLMRLRDTDAPEQGEGAVSIMDCALVWNDLIEEGWRAVRPRASHQKRLMVFLDLIQDADLCLPIVAAARERRDITVRVVVTRWLAENSPRSVSEFQRLGIEPELVDRSAVIAGRAPDIETIDAFLSPVATNLNAHKRVQAIVDRAAAMGIPTFSMQHGLENVGLTFFDDMHSEAVKITTDYLFVWFSPEWSPPALPELRRKFIHVGTVKKAPVEIDLPLPNASGRPLIAIFENLHWHRYSDEFRNRFMSDLFDTVAAFPNRDFVLKPHHGGRWASKVGLASPAKNLTILDPKDPVWEPFTAPAIIAKADYVITTPSTVALDAALADKPVAVVGYDLDLPIFAPLKILRFTADWAAIVARPQPDIDAGRKFKRRSVMRQDCAPQLLDSLVDLAGAKR